MWLENLVMSAIPIITIGSLLALFLAVLALYVNYSAKRKEPTPTPSLYQAMTNVTPRQLKKQQSRTFAQSVEVAPEMAQLRDGFNKIRTPQQLMASLSPEMKASLEPILSNVAEKHFGQIISDAFQATQKLQQLELGKQLEIEVSIVENEAMIANVAEQFRIIERIEKLLFDNTPKLTSDVGQAIWQAVIHTEVVKHLDTLGVPSDLRAKVLAPLEKYEMLETADEFEADPDLDIHIANLTKDGEATGEEYPDFIEVEARDV